MNELRICCCSLPDMCGPQVCETCINNNSGSITLPHEIQPMVWYPTEGKIKREVKEYDIWGNLIKHEIEYYDTVQKYFIGIDPY